VNYFATTEFRITHLNHNPKKEVLTPRKDFFFLQPFIILYYYIYYYYIYYIILYIIILYYIIKKAREKKKKLLERVIPSFFGKVMFEKKFLPFL
jgi:predicted membrane protein